MSVAILRKIAGVALIVAVGFSGSGFLSSATAFDTVSYRYDALGRLKSVIYGNGRAIQYSYDATGNRTTRVVSVPNMPPVAVDDTVVFDIFETAYVYPLTNDTDPDEDLLTVTDYSSNSLASTVIYNEALKRFSITSTLGGSFSVSYTISDGRGGTDTAIIRVTVEEEESDPCEGPFGPIC